MLQYQRVVARGWSYYQGGGWVEVAFTGFQIENAAYRDDLHETK
jgi:hypothetical protein